MTTPMAEKNRAPEIMPGAQMPSRRNNPHSVAAGWGGRSRTAARISRGRTSRLTGVELLRFARTSTAPRTATSPGSHLADGPVFPRNQLRGFAGIFDGSPERSGEHTSDSEARREGPLAGERLKQANGGIQSAGGFPIRIAHRQREQLGGLAPADTQRSHAAAKRAAEFSACGPLAPRLSRDGHLMDVEIAGHLTDGQPAAAGHGIHHLQLAAYPAPQHHEMREAVGQAHDGDGGQRGGFGKHDVIGGNNHLFGIQPQLVSELFHGIDGGAIHRGLAGFAEPAVTRAQAEAGEQGGQAGRTTVHRRRLHHFRNQKAAGHLLVRLPAVLLLGGALRGGIRRRGCGCPGEISAGLAQYIGGRGNPIDLHLERSGQPVL